MKKRLLASSLLVATVFALSSCGGDTADLIEELQGEVDALTTSVETLEGQNATLEDTIEALETQIAVANQDIAAIPFYLMDETALSALGYYKGVGPKDNNYHSDTVLFVKFANDTKISSIIYSDKGNFALSGKHNASTPVMEGTTQTYLDKWVSNADTYLKQFVGLTAAAVSDLAITYTAVPNSTSGQSTIAIPSSITVVAGVTYSSGMAAAAVQDACNAYIAAHAA